MGGFGPTVEDGYGICYAQSAIGVGLSISSFSTCEETSSSAMKAAIHDSFRAFLGCLIRSCRVCLLLHLCLPHFSKNIFFFDLFPPRQRT